jgi:hypothetical protein
MRFVGVRCTMDSTLSRVPSPTHQVKAENLGGENERGLRENLDQLYFPSQYNVDMRTMALEGQSNNVVHM